MRFAINLSLQRKMVLLVFAVLALCLGLFSWLGIQSLNESTARTLEERLTTARYAASHVDETLEHILEHQQSAADSLGELPEEAFERVALSLRDVMTESRITIHYVVLLDKDGAVIRTQPEGPGIDGLNFSGHDEVARVFDTGRATISSLISTLGLEDLAVLATAPILDTGGRTVGALSSIIDVNRSSLGTLHEPVFYGETVYSEVVDANGAIITRTEPGRPLEPLEQSDHPGRFAELISAGEATVRTCHRCHGPEDQPERRRDVLAFAPLSTASWGVAIRQTEEEALAPTRQLQERLIISGTAVLASTLFLTWLVMQGVMKPIKTLTTASRKVAAGDFNAASPDRRGDEIGQLGVAFSRMTRELARSRDELVSRSEDLSALNSVSAMVSQSLNLEEVVANALRKVLEVVRGEAGCVYLLGPDGSSLEMKYRIDPSDLFGCQEASSRATACACHQALQWKHAQLVNDVSQCSRMSDDLEVTKGLGCFVCIPLRATRRVLGVMNVAFSSERSVVESDLKLLDSIGYHVGLALDNSILYEEAREEEALRGRLLDSAISAQEEERKRIARELHDEYGQIMTGLIWSIESIENVIPEEQEQTRAKLTNAKSLASHAMEVTRRLSLDLRPPALDDLGLIAAIRAFAQAHLEAVGVQLRLRIEGSGKRLAPSVEITIFRIVQEAVHNVAKHAEAQSVMIRIFRDSGKIAVVVEDDGKGFDVNVVLRSGSKAQSLGLLGIRERVALLNGRFDIRSTAGEGTRLTVEIPVDDSLQGEPSGDSLAPDGELE